MGDLLSPQGGGGLTDGDYGDATVGGSGTTITVDPNAITLAKLADIATASFLGRTTASTGDPEVLTAIQATALLDVFTSVLKGLVPASGGGTTAFLRADATWVVPAGGASFPYGDGSDGTIVYDGTTTILGMAPTGGNTYTLTRDIYPDTMTVNSGITIVCAGYGIFVKTLLTGAGTISRKGNDAVNSSAGVVGAAGGALTGGRLPGAGSGGAGVNANINGNAAGNISGTPQGYTGAGGAGGSGTGGGGGAGGTATEASHTGGGWRILQQAIKGRNLTETLFACGPGGGGGAGNSGSPSGSGGGGGGWLPICAYEITGTLTFTVAGGTGGAAFAGGGNSGGGGGGKGGVLVLAYGKGSTATLVITGGGGGAGTGSGTAGASGSSGVSLVMTTGA